MRRLRTELPAIARIDSIETEEPGRVERHGFYIEATETSLIDGAFIPADMAVCTDCLREMFDPMDRRHGYPFINCTNCGPRYTITRRLPYDRAETSMASFRMCPECEAEYHDPDNRRFHAQPNACPVCGPSLRFVQRHGGAQTGNDGALKAALDLLADGRVLALRGLGGYHLAVDARNDEAVRLLRLRKRREEKPLAVMVRDMETAAGLCGINDCERALICSPVRPIVLLKKTASCNLSPDIAPGNPELGVMLPYTPLHHLLLADSFDALVMTSGNFADEPICISEPEAEERLSGIADGFLHHNRGILQRCDDSITRISMGLPRVLRRARGFVPSPLELWSDGPDVLAAGADLKNTICVAKGNTAVPGQHIGDMEHYQSAGFWQDTVDHLLAMTQAVPAVVAHDLHPGYLSSSLARRWAAEHGNIRLVGVQHHHAHLASCLAEHGRDDEAIGVILDGTGYGTDGSMWGGEFLTGCARGFKRIGSFRPVPMPGGDAAIREPWRMAVATLIDSGVFSNEEAGCTLDGLLEDTGIELVNAVAKTLRSGINTVQTSGCGRLFDAAAAIMGLCRVSAYEAQAAMLLEFQARQSLRPVLSYGFDLVSENAEIGGRLFVLDFRGTISDIAGDVRAGVPLADIAMRFHRTVIDACYAGAERTSAAAGLRTVALSGGVFQNTIILDGLVEMLQNNGYEVLTHERVPANDGGISLGQAAVARAALEV
jgi:hydrogenase maturation protein HypF